MNNKWKVVLLLKHVHFTLFSFIFFIWFHFGVFLYLCVLFHLSFVHYVSFLDIFFVVGIPPPPIFLWICGLFVTQSLNITLLFSLIPLFTSWWVTVCTFWVLLMTALHNKFLNNLSLQTPLFPLTELTPHLNSVFQIDSPWWKNCIKQF